MRAGLIALLQAGSLIHGAEAKSIHRRSDKCLNAVASAGPKGLADCLRQLAIMVMPSANVCYQTSTSSLATFLVTKTIAVTASDVHSAAATSVITKTVTASASVDNAQSTVLLTETSIATATIVQSAVATILVTETSTASAIIQSSVFTSLLAETTTSTASTETLTFTESTTSVSTTTELSSVTTTALGSTTVTATLATVTSTVYDYGGGNAPAGKLKARAVDSAFISHIPDYALSACAANATRYAEACKSAGAAVLTVKAPTCSKTMTVPVSGMRSAVVTLTTTLTETISPKGRSSIVPIITSTQTRTVSASPIRSVVSTLTITQTQIISASVISQAVLTSTSTQTRTVSGSTVISVVSTVTSTQTETRFATATASLTQTVTVGQTVTSSSTTTITSTSLTTLVETATSTAQVVRSCRPTGVSFQATNPFPDGSTRYMNNVNNAVIAWQTTSTPNAANILITSVWIINSNGELQRSAQNAGTTLVAYIVIGGSASRQVSTGAQATVDTNVAAGLWARVRGCIEPDTGVLRMSTVGGRVNMLSCGNALHLSTGDGTDVRADCVKLSPVAIDR